MPCGGRTRSGQTIKYSRTQYRRSTGRASCGSLASSAARESGRLGSRVALCPAGWPRRSPGQAGSGCSGLPLTNHTVTRTVTPSHGPVSATRHHSCTCSRTRLPHQWRAQIRPEPAAGGRPAGQQRLAVPHCRPASANPPRSRHGPQWPPW